MAFPALVAFYIQFSSLVLITFSLPSIPSLPLCHWSAVAYALGVVLCWGVFVLNAGAAMRSEDPPSPPLWEVWADASRRIGATSPTSCAGRWIRRHRADVWSTICVIAMGESCSGAKHRATIQLKCVCRSPLPAGLTHVALVACTYRSPSGSGLLTRPVSSVGFCTLAVSILLVAWHVASGKHSLSTPTLTVMVLLCHYFLHQLFKILHLTKTTTPPLLLLLLTHTFRFFTGYLLH